jgi:hypothetical protein
MKMSRYQYAHPNSILDVILYNIMLPLNFSHMHQLNCFLKCFSQVLHELEGDVIFVEEVKKSKILCDEIVLVDTQNQEAG